MRFDAVIVGGSFAGLAVAGGLKGDVLLIERNEIGSQTASACLTLQPALEQLGCMDAVVQVYDVGYIHTQSRTAEFHLPFPLCLFDYEKLCQTLVDRLDATIVKANVRGLQEDGSVVTDAGSFEGHCIIDASGWRAVLARSLEADFVDRSRMSFGIEATTGHAGDGVHFWIDPRLIRRGVGWVFPGGEHGGIGIGSYAGDTKLGPKLSSMVDRVRAPAGKVHGGYFPWRRRRSTVGEVFLVGDAAGQCLPLTGEGIRPGMYFGMKCAEIVQEVIEGKISLKEAIIDYSAVTKPFRTYYMLLEGLQRGLFRLPNPWLTSFLAFLSKQTRCDYVLHQYERRMDLSSVATSLRMADRVAHG